MENGAFPLWTEVILAHNLGDKVVGKLWASCGSGVAL